MSMDKVYKLPLSIYLFLRIKMQERCSILIIDLFYPKGKVWEKQQKYIKYFIIYSSIKRVKNINFKILRDLKKIKNLTRKILILKFSTKTLF